jgi:hypothetical protein
MGEWAPIVQLIKGPEPKAIQPATQVNPPVEVVDGVYKWCCPHCTTKVSVDTAFLEQIWQEYHGKISCPSCSQEIQAPQVDANPMPSEMEAEHPGEGNAANQPRAPEPLSDSQAHVSCPNCWAPVEPDQAVCTGCGYNLQTNTAAPEIPPSASVKELEDLREQIRKFLTILFFEPFTFAICGPKPGKWTGHALGLVGLTIIGFVIGRVYAVIILLRILKTFGAAGVKEFGGFQIMYKVHHFCDYWGDLPWRQWKIPLEIMPLKACSILPLMPLVFILIFPAVGSFCMHKMHKKLLAILSTIQIKEVT